MHSHFHSSFSIASWLNASLRYHLGGGEKHPHHPSHDGTTFVIQMELEVQIGLDQPRAEKLHTGPSLLSGTMQQHSNFWLTNE